MINSITEVRVEIEKELTTHSYFISKGFNMSRLIFIKFRYNGVRKIYGRHSYTDRLYYLFYLSRLRKVLLSKSRSLNTAIIQINKFKDDFENKKKGIIQYRINNSSFDEVLTSDELDLAFYYIDFLERLIQILKSSESTNNVARYQEKNDKSFEAKFPKILNSTGITEEVDSIKQKKLEQIITTKHQSETNSLNQSTQKKRLVVRYFNDLRLLQDVFAQFKKFVHDNSQIDYIDFKNLLFGDYEDGHIKIIPDSYGSRLIFITFYLLNKNQIIVDKYYEILGKNKIIATETNHDKYYEANTICSNFSNRWNREKDEFIPFTDSTLFKAEIFEIQKLINSWKPIN